MVLLDPPLARPDLLVNILKYDDLTAFSLAMTLMCYIVYKFDHKSANAR